MKKHTVSLGGDRLGSGKKQKIAMRNYERSTHDLGYIWRSTMSSGTLVPFMSELMLRGDVFEIGLDVDVLTHPTVGPMFASYKVQLDVFTAPIRLYQNALHMNKLGIGLDMASVKLPQLHLTAKAPRLGDDLDNSQINPSSVFSYFNIRGLGWNSTAEHVERRFNAVPYIAYFDIFKNYYANKQEENAYIIHNPLEGSQTDITECRVYLTRNAFTVLSNDATNPSDISDDHSGTVRVAFLIADFAEEFDSSRVQFYFIHNGNLVSLSGDQVFGTWSYDEDEELYWGVNYMNPFNLQAGQILDWEYYEFDTTIQEDQNVEPRLREFPLSNIDDMRLEILQAPLDGTPFIISEGSLEPYSLPLFRKTVDNVTYYSKMSSQEGLLVKTYQSDLFNNFVNTEWIDGDNGINEVTKVITDNDGNFTINELNLKNKLYNMLMRVGVSDGTYDSWQDAVYGVEAFKRVESPVYHGGLIKELAFNSVISNAATETQPLGTLGGRGQLTGKHKGGRAYIKAHEAQYAIAIVFLTPRLDYSQGNKWDVNLENMDDFHKPQLDQIGFQDGITDQMYFIDSLCNPADSAVYVKPSFRSFGKQPAWINYMTNVNQCRGQFTV